MSTESDAPTIQVVRRSKREIIASRTELALQPRSVVPATVAPVRTIRSPNMNLGSLATSGLPIVGFAEGTMILCKVGEVEQYVAIQDLRKESLVKTPGGYRAVNIVGSRAVVIPESSERPADRLYTLSKDKFPDLTQDLTVSGRRGILIDNATDADKRCTISAMGHLCNVDHKFCLPVCAHADAALSSTVGAVTLYNFSLGGRKLTEVHGVYANGLLVDHSSSYSMMSTEYSRLQ